MQKQGKSRNGLTLIETLIAIVLVVALGALVLPSLLNSIDERAFESAADVTNEQLMMARAHAQATGSPVEVTYHPSTAEVQVRMFTALLPEFGVRKSPTPSVHGKSLPAFDATDDGAPRPENSLISESWACRSLSHGMRLTSRPPSSAPRPSAASAPVLAASDEVETIADLAGGQDIRLAVFMPDGSALLGDPVWLNDDGGRCGMFTINPWSGLPVFQRVNEIEPDVEALSSTDDDESNFNRPRSAAPESGDQRRKVGDERKSGKTPKPQPPASTEEDDFIGGGG